MNNKVVLAYSGGLDTSYCVKYLTEEKKLDVYAITVNTGGFSEEQLQAIEIRAKELGVKEKQICEILEIKKIDDIDLDKLSVLRGMVTLIKNGESTIADLFSPSNGIDVDDLQFKYENMKSNLTAEQQENIERIFKNKEVQHYSKIQTILANEQINAL